MMISGDQKPSIPLHLHSMAIYDALIVGSGPAGLSIALGLSRIHRRAAIFTKPGGAGFRNAGVHEMHNVISQVSTPPEEFRRIATYQIKEYGTVDFLEAEIVAMKAYTQNGAANTFHIEGYAENWPQNIFQCLFSDGHERSHLPGGILTFLQPMYTHLAQMMHLLVTPTSGPVTVFTDGPVPEDEAMKGAMEKVNALQCNIETEKILRLVPIPEPDMGVRVVLEGGKEYNMGYLAHKPRTVLAGLDMITQLGVEIEDDPILGQSVKVDQLFSTNVRGLFIAGDAATPKVVANAMGSGSTVAAGIVQQLIAEDMDILLAGKKAAT
ncbi:thioredoxin reductase [Aspergillus udagawae]|nr:thioredoxin reductase [Aspergillus udagawae]